MALRVMAVVSDPAAMFAPMVVWMSQSSILPASFKLSNLSRKSPSTPVNLPLLRLLNLLGDESAYPVEWIGRLAFVARNAKGHAVLGKDRRESRKSWTRVLHSRSREDLSPFSCSQKIFPTFNEMSMHPGH